MCKQIISETTRAKHAANAQMFSNTSLLHNYNCYFSFMDMGSVVLFVKFQLKTYK